MSVQLLHLVSDWQLVIQEARRVMVDHGNLILGYMIQTDDSTPDFKIAMHFREELNIRGVQRRKDFLEQYSQIHQLLVESGASFEESTASVWMKVTSADESLDSIKHKVASHSWDLPDAEYFDALEATRLWVSENISDPNRLYEVPSKFAWQRYQW